LTLSGDAEDSTDWPGSTRSFVAGKCLVVGSGEGLFGNAFIPKRRPRVAASKGCSALVWGMEEGVLNVRPRVAASGRSRLRGWYFLVGDAGVGTKEIGGETAGGDTGRSPGTYEDTAIGSGRVRRLRNGGVARVLEIVEATCDGALLEDDGVVGASGGCV
jgi:hypothetical protein